MISLKVLSARSDQLVRLCLMIRMNGDRGHCCQSLKRAPIRIPKSVHCRLVTAIAVALEARISHSIALLRCARRTPADPRISPADLPHLRGCAMACCHTGCTERNATPLSGQLYLLQCARLSAFLLHERIDLDPYKIGNRKKTSEMHKRLDFRYCWCVFAYFASGAVLQFSREPSFSKAENPPQKKQPK